MRFVGFRILQNLINIIRFIRKARDGTLFTGPSVWCPSCTQALYRITPQSGGEGAPTGDRPSILSDGNGSFMICPHCFERIAMERDPSAPGGTGYRLEGRSAD